MIDPERLKRMCLAISRNESKDSFALKSDEGSAMWDELVKEDEKLTRQGLVSEFPSDSADW